MELRKFASENEAREYCVTGAVVWAPVVKMEGKKGRVRTWCRLLSDSFFTLDETGFVKFRCQNETRGVDQVIDEDGDVQVYHKECQTEENEITLPWNTLYIEEGVR